MTAVFQTQLRELGKAILPTVAICRELSRASSPQEAEEIWQQLADVLHSASGAIKRVLATLVHGGACWGVWRKSPVSKQLQGLLRSAVEAAAKLGDSHGRNHGTSDPLAMAVGGHGSPDVEAAWSL